MTVGDRHPLATADDPHAYRATVRAVRNLLGRPALSLETAWGILLRGEDGPTAMPADARGPVEVVLREFGYREHMVTPVGGHGSSRLWIREPWLVETVEEVPLT